jgi:hypothetical protein
MPELKYPDDSKFFRDLVLQRTDALTRLVGFDPVAKWFSTGDGSDIEKHYHSPAIRDGVLKALEADFVRDADQILNLVNPSDGEISNVVSIGPGNGVLETLLLKKMSKTQKSLGVTLIDIEVSDSHHHGYASTGSGYANLGKTRDFMVENGIKPSQIGLCNPQKQSLPVAQFDLLISILSMGFHYPCDGYADYLKGNCKDTGIIVIDKRKSVIDRGYDELLASGFHIAKKIDFGKFERVALTQKFATGI